MNTTFSPGIRDELGRILGSRSFAKAERLRELIAFLVEKTLRDPKLLLKESVLGVEFFRRGPDYDPKIDPIVRVEFRRLRGRLAQYYAGEGACNPLRIALEPGSYVPLFKTAPAEPKLRTRSIAVLPFRTFSPNQQDAYFAEGLVEEILNAMAQQERLQVIGRAPSSSGARARLDRSRGKRHLNVDHVIEGSLRREAARRRISVRLVVQRDGFVAWSRQFDTGEAGDFAAQEVISRQVAAAATRVSGPTQAQDSRGTDCGQISNF